jgi:hypothetical protein
LSSIEDISNTMKSVHVVFASIPASPLDKLANGRL